MFKTVSAGVGGSLPDSGPPRAPALAGKPISFSLSPNEDDPLEPAHSRVFKAGTKTLKDYYGFLPLSVSASLCRQR
jgi:hypothetical protein